MAAYCKHGYSAKQVAERLCTRCILDELARTRAQLDEARERLARSATVCPKDGCMLWKGHGEPHADLDTVRAALAAARKETTP